MDNIGDEIVHTAEENIDKTSKFFTKIWDWFLEVLPSLITAVVVLAVGLLLTKLVLKLMQKGLDKSKIEVTAVNFIKSLSRIVLYILLFCIVLSIVGIPMTSIVAVVSTMALAIGMSLKDSLSNVAGGFIILFTKPFKIGDFIETDSVKGEVKQISILYTMVNDLAGNRMVYIPNGTVISQKVSNYTKDGLVRVDWSFGISYDAVYDEARKCILDVLAQTENVSPKIPISVRMADHGNSAIKINVRAWTEYDNYWGVYCDVMEGVRRSFIDNGIEIPFDQLDVHVINSSDSEKKRVTL